MYLNKPLKEYLDDLAAKLPAPGGGSASALVASIGASLMAMVANYTVSNPKYKEIHAKAAGILDEADKARAALQGLIDKDVQAYERLSKGIKEVAAKDSQKLDSLYKEAANVPFEIARLSDDCLKLCNALADCGNSNLVTDTAIAAILLEGSFFSAKYNVYINLKYIKDMDYIANIHKILAPLEEMMPKLKEEIIEKCEDVIGR